MENTIAVQLHLDQEMLRLLDEAARAKSQEQSPQMSLVEWNKSPRGREFFLKLETDPNFRRMSIEQINRLQRQMYREDVPARRGRPRMHDARVAVIKEALVAHLHANRKAA